MISASARDTPEESARKSAWQFIPMTDDPRLSMLRRFGKAMEIPLDELLAESKKKPDEMMEDRDDEGKKKLPCNYRNHCSAHHFANGRPKSKTLGCRVRLGGGANSRQHALRNPARKNPPLACAPNYARNAGISPSRRHPMTRKRRYLISATVLAACVCIVIGVLAMLPPRPGVTKANFDRIQLGMIKVTVQEILGEGRTVHEFKSPEGFELVLRWTGDEPIFVTVYFLDDVVVRKQCAFSPETIPNKLRRWLHLPKTASSL